MTSSRSTVPLLGTVGALVFTGVGVLQTIDPTFPGEPAFAGRNVPSAIGALLMVGLVVGLHRSGAAGERRLVRLGLGAAALGWVVDAAAQLISQAMGVDYPPPYVAALALLVFGMLPPRHRGPSGGCLVGMAAVDTARHRDLPGRGVPATRRTRCGGQRRRRRLGRVLARP